VAELTIAVTGNCEPIMAVINELSSLELSAEVKQAFLDLGDDWSKLVRCESLTTPGAGIAITFYPSEYLLTLLAAARAGGLDRG